MYVSNDLKKKQQLQDEFKKAHTKCIPNPFQIMELELDIWIFRPKKQFQETHSLSAVFFKCLKKISNQPPISDRIHCVLNELSGCGNSQLMVGEFLQTLLLIYDKHAGTAVSEFEAVRLSTHIIISTERTCWWIIRLYLPVTVSNSGHYSHLSYKNSPESQTSKQNHTMGYWRNSRTELMFEAEP